MKRGMCVVLCMIGLLLTGCPIPVPRTAVIQPALTIQVLDEKGRPLVHQEVRFSWYSHPHRRFHRADVYRTDKYGKITFAKKTKREWVMPLMMHGVPQHYWVVCLNRKGYDTLARSYYIRPKRRAQDVWVLRLKKGKYFRTCKESKRGR